MKTAKKSQRDHLFTRSFFSREVLALDQYAANSESFADPLDCLQHRRQDRLHGHRHEQQRGRNRRRQTRSSLLEDIIQGALKDGIFNVLRENVTGVGYVAVDWTQGNIYFTQKRGFE